jgi:general secretion pathway protein D
MTRPSPCTWPIWLVLPLIMTACATDDALEKRSEAPAKVQHANERYMRTNALFSQAEAANQAGQPEEAGRLYNEILQLDPGNARAESGLRLIEVRARHGREVDAAGQLLEAGDMELARRKLRTVLIEDPEQPAARVLLQDIEARSYKDQITPRKLKPSRSKTVSLEFRDANLHNIFDVISRTSGLNFVFDPGIKQDLRASIFVKDASVEDTVDFLLVMHQLGKKVLTENSLLIFPIAKAGQYDELIMRSFYLTHADAKQTMALIKAMMPIKDLFVDDKLNMLTMKATYDQLRDVEKLIADEDMPDPEVVLDVEILEVKRSRLTDLGLVLPDQISVLGAADGSITWRELRRTNGSNINLSPVPTINLLRQDGDTNLLANPRIRVKNREKAKIHIGDKIPIETTTISSASNFASKSANYLDVGLKLDVEPRVMLNNDVSIRVNLEVSNATLPTGATFPTVNTRTTSTVLMTGDGETQVLAGLINDEDRQSAKKVPGLSSIPLLGRLFTDKADSRAKTEVVLLITPHVVRNILRPEARNAEFYGGTGTRANPINFNPTAVLQQFTGIPAARPAPAPGQLPTPGSAAAAPAEAAPAPGTPQPLGKPIGAD